MQTQLKIIVVLSGLMLSACTSAQSQPLSTPTTPPTKIPTDTAPTEDYTTQDEINLTPQPTIDLRAMGMVAILPRDIIPSIDDPTFLDADEADSEYAPYELVIGVEINGDTRAYSAPFLSRHEIVNDTVGGRAIAVTWCPLCFTALVYDRTIDGVEYTFGVSGRLMHNGLVMFDRETDSFWPQMLGEAVYGPMLGTKLEYLPAFQTTWEDWKNTHPDTLALEKGYFGDDDPYLNYFEFDYAGVVSPNRIDNRLHQKEFVIGVEHLGSRVAFPFSVLSLEPIANHFVGETPILAVFNDQTATGVAYLRTLPDGQVLNFKVIDGMTLLDEETGSTWNGISGEAIDGHLAGTQLTRARSTLSFWFAWFDFYPDTDIYLPESSE